MTPPAASGLFTSKADLRLLRNMLLIFGALYIISHYFIVCFEIPFFSEHSGTYGLLGELLAFPIFYIVITHCQGGHRKAWQLFTIAAAFYFCGDLLWEIYEEVLDLDPASPSLCDIFYFANTIFCLIAFIRLMRENRSISRTGLSLDLIICITAFAGLVYAIIIEPMQFNEELTMLQANIELAYAFGDVALLLCFFVLFFNTDPALFFSPGNILMGSTFLMMFIIDCSQLYFDINGIEINADLTDPLWSFVYLGIALAGICHIAEEQGDGINSTVAVRGRGTMEYTRIIMPYITALVLILIMGYAKKLFDFTYVWCFLLLILLTSRQLIIIIRHQHLLEALSEKEHELNIRNDSLQKLNAKILHDAEIDFLTELYNRRHVDELLREYRPEIDEHSSLGLMLIDVDLFKHINDTHGHQTGDEVLVSVAGEIRRAVGSDGCAARFGGDEFIILLNGCNREVVSRIADCLHRSMHEHPRLSSLGVTLSIGGTYWHGSSTTYDTNLILKTADEALYQAKNNGRDQAVYRETPALTAPEPPAPADPA